MFFQRVSAVLFSSILLASCVSPSNPAPQSAIAGCGGGIERSITARVEADYAKASLGGKVDAGFADTIRAAFDAKGDGPVIFTLGVFQT